MLKRFQKEAKTKFVFPIIVKHKFKRNYLSKKQEYGDIALCGDRRVVILSENEQKIVYALVKEPTATYTRLAKLTNISIKTVIKLKKNLEQKNIIKGYSCYPHLANAGIKRAMILIKPADINDLDKIIAYGNNNKNRRISYDDYN